jgi:hypothetical protein
MILGGPAFDVEQVGGDYGDPWIYGGTWHDDNKGLLYHIDGLEGEGVKDIEPDDLEVPPELVRQIVVDLGGDPDQSWKDNDEQQEHYIEREVENAIGEWQYDRAKEENAKVHLTLHIAPDQFNPALQRSLEAERQSFDAETWEQITQDDVAKITVVAEREGWDHVSDNSMRVTKAQLTELLGMRYAGSPAWVWRM